MNVSRRFSRARVWGHHPGDLEIKFEGAELDGLVRQDSGIETVAVRPTLGRDHYRVEAVRRANRAWLEPWDATLPPGGTERLPTWAQYMRQLDDQMRESKGLTMMVEVNREIAGQVSLGAVEHGAMSQGILGYWMAQRWAGYGIASLAVAAVMDLVLTDLDLHRIEVNVKPDNDRSLALCKNLRLRREGYRPRFMSIAGEWADHVSFGIDQQDIESGPVVERIRRR